MILTGGPFVVIDLDYCVLETGIISEAEEIVRLFPEAYVEVSPSGKGLQIIFRGSISLDRERAVIPLSEKYGAGIEIYSRKSTCFITLTGNPIEGFSRIALRTRLWPIIGTCIYILFV